MTFIPNITSVEVTKKGAFARTYFRGICFSVHDTWHKNPQKEFNVWGNVDQKHYYSNYYDESVNKYGLKCGTSLRIWKNKG